MLLICGICLMLIHELMGECKRERQTERMIVKPIETGGSGINVLYQDLRRGSRLALTSQCVTALC